MFSWLKKRRERILTEADEFMELYGNTAYSAARAEAREARKRGDTRRDRFLSKVCLEIAKRTDFEPGLDTATRYLDSQEPYSIDGPPLVRKKPDGETLH